MRAPPTSIVINKGEAEPIVTSVHKICDSVPTSLTDMTQPRNFSWFVEGKMAAMAYPVASQGIKSLVNLTADQYYLEAARAHGIATYSISIPEFYPPSMAQFEEFLQIVDNANAVQINCAAL